jgi:hemoglobin-like flavoprotein
MFRIFIEHEELKQLWSFSKGLDTTDQMRSSSFLKTHGIKLFNAIDLAIKNLDNLNVLIPVLIQLGFSHYMKGVREEHFPVSKTYIIFLKTFF